MDSEIYKQIVGYENYYEVSNYGNVRSTSYKGVKILKPSKTKNGYLNVILCVKQVKVNKLIHRLVAECFLENKDNLPVVNHIDCNKINNNYQNLEWTTVEYNNEHAKSNNRLQRYEDRPASKITRDGAIRIPELIKLGATTDDLKNYFGVSRRCIDNIFEGKNWTGLGIDFTKLKPNRKVIGVDSKFIISMDNTEVN